MNQASQSENQSQVDNAAASQTEISDDSNGHAPATWVPEKLLQIVEAALLAAGGPLSLAQLANLFTDQDRPDNGLLRETLALLEESCSGRGIELKQVASGYRLQVREELQPWISRLWQERPKRYSRALLETLALIAYRQPVTRAEIEDVRGVSVSTNIIRTLLEREWVREVGHRDVPGRPVLFGTTKVFLDYFNLKSLDELPTLAEIQDLDNLEPELALTYPDLPDTPASAANESPDVANQSPADDDQSLNESANAADDEDHPPDEPIHPDREQE